MGVRERSGGGWGRENEEGGGEKGVRARMGDRKEKGERGIWIGGRRRKGKGRKEKERGGIGLGAVGEKRGMEVYITKTVQSCGVNSARTEDMPRTPHINS